MRQPTTQPTFPSADQIEELTEASFRSTNKSDYFVCRWTRLSRNWAGHPRKVLDRLPRAEFPCDERFELPATDDRRGFEHAGDSGAESDETMEVQPPAPAARRLQAKLW